MLFRSYRNPKNYDLVVEALTKAGRTDLIGFDKKCLVRPRNIGYGKIQENAHSYYGKKNTSGKATGSRSGAVKKKTIRNVHKKKSGK